MPKRKNYDEDEYEDEDDEDEYEDEDDDGDEVTLDDINKGLDTLNKGLDFYAKLKKLNTPPPQRPQPRPISNEEAKWINQDMIRKQKIDEQERNRKIEEDKKKHKKWVIDTIIKVAVPVVVALIGVGFYLFKH